jgi:hypothetical protein
VPAKRSATCQCKSSATLPGNPLPMKKWRKRHVKLASARPAQNQQPSNSNGGDNRNGAAGGYE